MTKIELTKEDMAKVLTMFSLASSKDYDKLSAENTEKIKDKILNSLLSTEDLILESLNLFEDLKKPVEERSVFTQEYLDKLKNIKEN